MVVCVDCGAALFFRSTMKTRMRITETTAPIAMPAMAPADSPSSSAIPVGGGDVGESDDVGGSGDGEGGGGGEGGTAMTTVETIVEVVTVADTLSEHAEIVKPFAARAATAAASSSAQGVSFCSAGGHEHGQRPMPLISEQLPALLMSEHAEIV